MASRAPRESPPRLKAKARLMRVSAASSAEPLASAQATAACREVTAASTRPRCSAARPSARPATAAASGTPCSCAVRNSAAAAVETVRGRRATRSSSDRACAARSGSAMLASPGRWPSPGCIRRGVRGSTEIERTCRDRRGEEPHMSGSTTEAGAGVHRLPMTARDQIVVNTLHRRLVEDEVRSLFQVTLTVADEAPELDLVLLQPDRAAESPSVDEMLTALYESFATRFGGWVPTFGKNRQVAHVIAENKIDGGAEGPPTAAAPKPELWATGPESHGRGVTIAVADTAVANRPELTGRLLADPAALLPGA